MKINFYFNVVNITNKKIVFYCRRNLQLLRLRARQQLEAIRVELPARVQSHFGDYTRRFSSRRQRPIRSSWGTNSKNWCRDRLNRMRLGRFYFKFLCLTLCFFISSGRRLVKSQIRQFEGCCTSAVPDVLPRWLYLVTSNGRTCLLALDPSLTIPLSLKNKITTSFFKKEDLIIAYNRSYEQRQMGYI